MQITTAHFDQPGAGDILFTSLLIGGPWLAGHTVRVRQQVGHELEERTVELEQARDEVARAAVVDERLRIARELHDVVAHSISVMTIQAGAARLLLDEGPERAEEPLLRVEETGRETLSEMRRLLGVLRQDEPERTSSRRARRSSISTHCSRSTARRASRSSSSSKATERTLPQGLDLAAYRVVQEALTNTLKHAAGATAVVRVAYRPRVARADGRPTAAAAALRRRVRHRAGSAAATASSGCGSAPRSTADGSRPGPARTAASVVSARFPLERVAA